MLRQLARPFASSARAAAALSKHHNTHFPYADPVTPLDPASAKSSCMPPSQHKVDAEAILAVHDNLDYADHDAQLKTDLERFSLLTWGANIALEPLRIARGEGCYVYDHGGRKYFDLNSQAMCSNYGHTVPDVVVDAITEQLRTIPYVYPCQLATPMKAKLSRLLASIVPGDINTFFYTAGGGETNEAAFRMARRFTGRQKILTRYRSYHGGQTGTVSATGDPRRWTAEPSAPGFVHFMDPWPYTFSMGASEEEVTKHSLGLLHETVLMEGPQNVAAILLECVTGSNGVLIPPKGYLEGVRALCDQYGILFIADEVMAGFLRTGKWFSFMHTDPLIVPDMVTMAKGINGGWLPLGALGVRDRLRDFFDANPVATGTTYGAHATTLASAYATLKWSLRNDVESNVLAQGKVLAELLTDLGERHPCVKQSRSIGLFSIIDLQRNTAGDPLSKFPWTVPHPAMAELRKHLLQNGVFTLLKPSGVFCNPPLIVQEHELREAMAVVDSGLDIVDAAMD